jgi:hypothetical protein
LQIIWIQKSIIITIDLHSKHFNHNPRTKTLSSGFINMKNSFRTTGFRIQISQWLDKQSNWRMNFTRPSYPSWGRISILLDYNWLAYLTDDWGNPGSNSGQA